MEKLYKDALRMLDGGLLPADLSNVYIFTKIITLIFLMTVLSGTIGFYFGLNAHALPH